MANFKNYNFNESQVTALAVDETNGQYLWIAYAKANDVCLLKKVSAHDLTQVYFSVSLFVDSINALKIYGTRIFAAVTHSTLAAYSLSLSSPLSSQTTYTKSTFQLTEAPIAIEKGATYLYFLTAGTTLAQIAKINSSGTFLERINLQEGLITVQNAVSFTIDTNENIWVVNNGNPASLYRVYYDSSWHVVETILE